MNPPAPSYVHGAVATQLLGQTVGESLDRTLARVPDRPALIVPSRDVRWSYASSPPGSMISPPGCWRWGWSRAIGSASGRPTIPNGLSRSSPPRRRG